jgi:amino acid adenylation domain-containing protein
LVYDDDQDPEYIGDMGVWHQPQPGDAAYAMYTSGTTGNPKAAKITHGQLVNMITSLMRRPPITARDRVLAVSNLTFDMSVLDIFRTLSAGGCIELGERELAADGVALARKLDTTGATVIGATPSTLRTLIEVIWQPLRPVMILAGGEALTRDVADFFLSRGCSLWNIYGTTETTACATIAEITSAADIHVGIPVDNMRIYILNCQREAVAIGEEGEIYIGGVGVGAGYINRPDLTAERFHRDPFVARDGAFMYQTGDIGRWRADGQVECLGRSDNQVKIRGIRVELAEIEIQLREHPAVRKAAVMLREDIPGYRQLVAYVVAEKGMEHRELHRELRDYLSARLPEYMRPSAYLFLERLPLSAAGKIDHKSLPLLTSSRLSTLAEPIPPRTALEKEIVQLFVELLHVQPVGVEDSFVLLGGHSLLAMSLASRLRDLYAVEIRGSQILCDGTPANLAACIESRRVDEQTNGQQRVIPLRRVERDQPLLLTYAQQRIWFIYQLDPESIEYNTPALCELRGKLDRDALRGALNEIIARHEIMRTTFHKRDGLPVQQISDLVPLELAFADLCSLDEEARTQQSRELQRVFFRQAFDLEHGPLFRFSLVSLTPALHRLLICMHHIISDDWTMNVFLSDLSAFYALKVGEKVEQPPPLAIQVADIASWQRAYLDEQRSGELLDFWRTQMLAAPQLLALPIHRPRPPQRSIEAETWDFGLDCELSAKLCEVAQSEGATTFMVLLAGFGALLYSETAQADLPIGTLSADRIHRELESLIGFFANTLVLRIDVAHNPSLRELLRRTREVALAAYAHQDLPFERLVQTMQSKRERDQQPLFQVCFILQDSIGKRRQCSDLEFELCAADNGTAAFDLTVQMWWAGGTLRGNFIYRRDIFERDTIAYLAERYRFLLDAIASDADQKLDLLPSALCQRATQILQARPSIIDAVVFPRADCHAQIRYLAYIVSHKPLDTDILRTYLYSKWQRGISAHWPDISALVYFVRVATLPLTALGDLDQNRLFELPVLDAITSADISQALPLHTALDISQLRVKDIRPDHQLIHLSDLPSSSPVAETEALDSDCNHTPKIAHTTMASTSTASNFDISPSDEGEPSIALWEGHKLEFPEKAAHTLLDIIRRAAKQDATRGIYTIDLDGSEWMLSYSELLEQAQAIARALRHIDIASHTPIILQLQRSSEFFTGLWACLVGRYTAVPLAVAPLYDADIAEVEKLLHLWQLLDAPPIIAAHHQVQALRELGIRRKLPSLRVLDFEELLDLGKLCDDTEALALPELDPEDLVLLLCTSGSTGKPKVVRHHHRTILSWLEAYRQHHNFSDRDIFLNWLPTDHVGGLFMNHTAAVYLGSLQIHAPTPLVLQRPLLWLDWIQRFGATYTWTPNFAFGLIADQAEALAQKRWDLSSLRIAMNGGEAIVSRTIRRFLELLAPHGLAAHVMVPAWGMSELCSASTSHTSYRREQTTDADPYVCVGLPMPGFAIRIADPTGRLLNRGQIGRLQVRGPSVMSGYHRLDEVNAVVFDAEGWFDTGDLGFIVEEGLCITGRSKNEIIINGINYPSHEIETAAEELPEVTRSFTAACAVRSHSDQTDQLAIFFTPRIASDTSIHKTPIATEQQSDFRHELIGPVPISRPQLAEILRKLRGEIARKIGITPRYLLPLAPQHIPKTDIGKLQHSRLKADFDGGKFASLLRELDLLLANERTMPNWFHRRIWQPKNLAGISFGEELIAQRGPVLVFTDDRGEIAELTAQIAQSGIELIRVYPGATYSQLDPHQFYIAPQNSDHYLKLLRDISANHQLPRSIIRLWTCTQPSNAVTTSEELLEQQVRAAESLLHLVQALAQHTKAETSPNTQHNDNSKATEQATSLQLLVVSRYAQAIHAQDPIVLGSAPLLGLMSCIPHELSYLVSRHIDLDASTSLKADARYILAELSDLYRSESEVAYRDGIRLVPRLEKLIWPQAPISPQQFPVCTSTKTDYTHQSQIPFTKGMTIAIIGGLGGLGIALARELILRFQAKLLLIGRTPREQLSPERSEALADLQRLADIQTSNSDSVIYQDGRFANRPYSDSVIYQALDVAHLPSLKAAIQDCEQRWQQALGGVCHLAAIFQDVQLVDETSQRFYEALRPKLLGLWNITEVLRHNPSTFLIDFSSINALLGGFGAGAYAATTRCGEVYAHYLRRISGNKVYYLLWSRWQDIGMSRDLYGSELLHLRGYHIVAIKQGMTSLFALLASAEGNYFIGLDHTNPHIRTQLLREPLFAEQIEILASRSTSDALTQTTQNTVNSSEHRLTYDSNVQTYGVNESITGEQCAYKPLWHGNSGLVDPFGVNCTSFIHIIESTAQTTSTERDTSGDVISTKAKSNRIDQAERELSAIWRELLDLQRVSIDDNFFDLGGHSMLLAQLQSRIEQSFQRECKLVDLFRYTTIRTQAAFLCSPAPVSDPATSPKLDLYASGATLYSSAMTPAKHPIPPQPPESLQQQNAEISGSSASQTSLSAPGVNATTVQREATEPDETCAPAIIQPLASKRYRIDDAYLAEHSSSIAVIGMAGRFPGASNIEHFWRNLAAGIESIRFFTPQELLAAGISQATIDDPSFVAARGSIEQSEGFDAHFFGIGAREAEITDPQHRMFLECAWSALEDAGYVPDTFNGRIGVYGGCSNNSYMCQNLMSNPDIWQSLDGLQIMVSNDKDHITTRVSYKLGLTGPSFAIQTGCSTSLVALQLACLSLLNHQCDTALAGGASLALPLIGGHFFQTENVCSPDGHTRSFDALAQGTIDGDGVGIVVLRRLKDALSDGDDIRAIIRAAAINNDGNKKAGYTAPSIDGQIEVIRAAQQLANITADTINYIEAHGTATPMGDPIEIEALTRAFRQTTAQKAFCAIGSVKSNFGHLSAAAGITGLIKTVLALQHQQIPPSLFFEQPNPKIDFANSPFFVNNRLQTWPRDQSPRRAAVSSLGVGGTNAHVILEEAPTPIVPSLSTTEQSDYFLCLSARTPAALDATTQQLGEYLRRNPQLSLCDVAYTLREGRRAWEYRRVIVADSIPQAAELLCAHSQSWISGTTPSEGKRQIAFLFPAQGAQQIGMGHKLYEGDAIFRAAFDNCCDILTPLLDCDPRSYLFPTAQNQSRAQQLINDQLYAGPAMFAISYALAQYWIARDIQPHALLGHSTGEYVAACIAGIFSLEDALKLLVARAKLLAQAPLGGVSHVPLAADELAPLLEPDSYIALINAPHQCVVAGTPDALAQLEHKLQLRDIPIRHIRVSVPAHSPLLLPLAGKLRTHAQSIKLSLPKIPMISGSTGEWFTDAEALDHNYWVRHMIQPIQFAKAMSQLSLIGDYIALEIGPHRSISPLILQNAPAQTVIHSLPHLQQPESSSIKQTLRYSQRSLAQLWTEGTVPIHTLPTSPSGRRISLPIYPFQRKRYWIEAKLPHTAGTNTVTHTSPSSVHTAHIKPSEHIAEQVTRISANTSRHPRPDLPIPYIEPRNAAERLVADICAELLALDRIGVRDHFLYLGADSMTMFRIVREIENRLGSKLRATAAFSRLTVEQLATHIAPEQLNHLSPGQPQPQTHHTESDTLIPLRPYGSRPALFIVHPAGGVIFPYFHLVQHLPQDLPVYALQAVGLDGSQPMDRSCQDMATRYVNSIQEFQPTGPYHIAGYSFGAYIAFEMAQILQTRNQQTAFLALIDEPSPLKDHRPNPLEAFRFLFGKLPIQSLHQHLQDYAQHKKHRWLSGLKHLIQPHTWMQLIQRSTLQSLAQESNQDLDLAQPALRSIFKMFALHFWLFYTYKSNHPIYQGPASIFKSEALEQSWYKRRKPDPLLGWSKLISGPIDTYLCPGDHLGMLRPPHVQKLASQLITALH